MREGHAGVTGIPWGARSWKPGRHAVRKPKRGHLRVFSLGALLRPSWATRILQAIPDSPFQTPRRCHEERKEGRHPRGALPGRRPTIRMKDSCGSEPRDTRLRAVPKAAGLPDATVTLSPFHHSYSRPPLSGHTFRPQ